MSILTYSEIKGGKIIVHSGEPCEVLEHHVARTQQRKPQNQVKLKSLISGKVFPATFHVSDKAEEADLSKRDVKFLYKKEGRPPEDGQEYWFSDPENPRDRFQIDESVLPAGIKFLKTNELVTALIFGEDTNAKIISVKLPIKVELKVTEAPPAIKGDTRTGGNKQVVLESGATINVPLFIEAGDSVRINTETGEYVERA